VDHNHDYYHKQNSSHDLDLLFYCIGFTIDGCCIPFLG
jgi:hypothetical protein